MYYVNLNSNFVYMNVCHNMYTLILKYNLLNKNIFHHFLIKNNFIQF